MVENRPLVFQGFPSSAFSTALGARQRVSSPIVATYDVRAVADRNGSAQMFVNGHRASGQ